VLLRECRLQLPSEQVCLGAARLLQCFKQQEVPEDGSRLHVGLLADLQAAAGKLVWSW
jgi:hypothetical protein